MKKFSYLWGDFSVTELKFEIPMSKSDLNMISRNRTLPYFQSTSLCRLLTKSFDKFRPLRAVDWRHYITYLFMVIIFCVSRSRGHGFEFRYGWGKLNVINFFFNSTGARKKSNNCFCHLKNQTVEKVRLINGYFLGITVQTLQLFF